MAEMKGIKLCGECGNYDWKKHKCKIGCNDDSNAQASFYGDCPLPDVVPKSEVERLKHQLEIIADEGEYWQGKFLVARSTVAREIFEEIEKDGKYAISFVENHKSYSEEVRQAKLECYKDIQTYIAELKKKYTKEGEDKE